MTPPEPADDQFDFDFVARRAQLDEIVQKWLGQSKPKQATRYVKIIAASLMDLLFALIDEGHPEGKETIKRNFELAELAGSYCGTFSLAGYCLGLEYGSRGLQPSPVTDVMSIPEEVKEMFVVATQPMHQLFLKLVTDVYNVREIGDKDVADRHKRFNVTAAEVLTSCYRLGVDEGMEYTST
jgi:hypothetical protein